MTDSLKTRMTIERSIVRNVAKNIFAAGHGIRVTCEGEVVGHTDIHHATGRAFASDAHCADDIMLEVINPEGKAWTWVRLVFGNDGYDVICDHGVSAQEFMLTDEAMDKYERRMMAAY